MKTIFTCKFRLNITSDAFSKRKNLCNCCVMLVFDTCVKTISRQTHCMNWSTMNCPTISTTVNIMFPQREATLSDVSGLRNSFSSFTGKQNTTAIYNAYIIAHSLPALQHTEHLKWRTMHVHTCSQWRTQTFWFGGGGG